MKVDILAFAAHPDDVEISCAATVAKQIALGSKVAIVDLTRGELGTRGSAEIRALEAAAASAILGVHARENLGFKDGFFVHDEAHLLKVIAMIRKYQPEIVLCNSPSDRHPDHGKAAKLVADACFLSGLPKVQTVHEGQAQDAWRPKVCYHYIQDFYLEPDFVVDVTGYEQIKLQAIKAYRTQFYDPASEEPETPIARKDFFDFLLGRMKDFGRPIGAEYAEGFVKTRHIGVTRLEQLL